MKTFNKYFKFAGCYLISIILLVLFGITDYLIFAILSVLFLLVVFKAASSVKDEIGNYFLFIITVMIFMLTAYFLSTVHSETLPYLLTILHMCYFALLSMIEIACRDLD